MSDKRMSWVDETTQLPVIETYASQLEHFVETFADGQVDKAELQKQERKLVDLMKEVAISQWMTHDIFDRGNRIANRAIDASLVTDQVDVFSEEYMRACWSYYATLN